MAKAKQQEKENPKIRIPIGYVVMLLLGCIFLATSLIGKQSSNDLPDYMTTRTASKTITPVEDILQKAQRDNNFGNALDEIFSQTGGWLVVMMSLFGLIVVSTTILKFFRGNGGY